jgi:glycosyltransferase involved in cell wall biosynthesis
VVVTLHDATFFSHPDAHLPVKARFFRAATRVAVRRAAALVVPSEATSREVRRFVGGAESRFHVAHHGVDQSRFHPVPAADQERVAASLGLAGRPYVGFLGTLEPRKNVPALVRAWAAVAAGAGSPALVLAGGAGWDPDIDGAVAAVPEGLTLVRPGYLPIDDLPGFLAGATVLAYPSIAEGFGLPVLEAMACGAAVLTSRELSLSEVGGDAVAYAGTDDASIARELAALLADEPRRRQLSVDAVARAARFTWDRAAQAHVEAYEAASRR